LIIEPDGNPSGFCFLNGSNKIEKNDQQIKKNRIGIPDFENFEIKNMEGDKNGTFQEKRVE
jgi:hypothetical protein